MPIPKPQGDEKQSEFIQRCMTDSNMQEYTKEQRLAVCYDAFKLAASKISFDFDDTLNTKKGTDLAQRLINEGADIYIISARESKDGMLDKAKELGIPESKVYATGSNEAKIAKIKELEIATHYDNNRDVINQLPHIGKLFTA